jgi:hypothetical protein
MDPGKKTLFSKERIFISTTIMIISIAILYNGYLLTDGSDTTVKTDHTNSKLTSILQQRPDSENCSIDEHRIAGHFIADTLPGLMKYGLIKRYERHNSGTLILVSGIIWKARSKFFKESLLTEIAVYNKVNSYTLVTKIVGYKSRRLYAQVLSDNQKEFFD